MEHKTPESSIFGIIKKQQNFNYHKYFTLNITLTLKQKLNTLVSFALINEYKNKNHSYPYLTRHPERSDSWTDY